jgi:hypothetical protein
VADLSGASRWLAYSRKLYSREIKRTCDPVQGAAQQVELPELRRLDGQIEENVIEEEIRQEREQHVDPGEGDIRATK